MDVIGGLSPKPARLRRRRRPRTSSRRINADEIQHVRFANRWIKTLAEAGPPVLMKMACAIRFLTHANANFQIKEGGEVNAVGQGAGLARGPHSCRECRGPPARRILRRRDPRDPAPGGISLARSSGGARHDCQQRPLRRDTPTRDARFEVKERWREMTNLPHDHPDVSLEFLHRQMNEEINASRSRRATSSISPTRTGSCAWRSPASAADEARHAIAFRRSARARGGYARAVPGAQLPVPDHDVDPFADRPAGGCQPQLRGRRHRRHPGRHRSVAAEGRRRIHRPFDPQLADEMQHVRFANVWIKKLIEREGARAVMALARAVAQADEAFKEIVGDDVVFYPVSDDSAARPGSPKTRSSRRTSFRRTGMTNGAAVSNQLSAEEIDAVATIWKREGRRVCVPRSAAPACCRRSRRGSRSSSTAGSSRWSATCGVSLRRSGRRPSCRRAAADVAADVGRRQSAAGRSGRRPRVIGTIRDARPAPKSVRRALLRRLLASPSAPAGIVTRRVRLAHRIRSVWGQGPLVFAGTVVRAVIRRLSPKRA